MRRCGFFAMVLCLTALGACHPSPEPETQAEAETLDVLRFEAVAHRWLQTDSGQDGGYRRLLQSTPIQERNKAVAIMAEEFTSRPMVPLPVVPKVADGAGKVADAVPGPVPVEKVTDPLTEPLTKPDPKQNRVLMLEVVDVSGEYHQALVHTAGLTPPPSLKDVASPAELADFDRIDPVIMSLMEDADTLSTSAPQPRPLIVLTYFDGGAWDAVAFNLPPETTSGGEAVANQQTYFAQVAAFVNDHLAEGASRLGAVLE